MFKSMKLVLFVITAITLCSNSVQARTKDEIWNNCKDFCHNRAPWYLGWEWECVRDCYLWDLVKDGLKAGGGVETEPCIASKMTREEYIRCNHDRAVSHSEPVGGAVSGDSSQQSEALD